MERSRFQRWPQKRPIAVTVTFGIIGVGDPARWSDYRCPDFATFRSTLKALDI